MRGISILLIAFFHSFIAYDNGRYPWPLSLASFPSFVSQCGGTSLWRTLGCGVEGLFATVFQRGPHAVGVFLVLSGFGLTYSLVKAGNQKGGWPRWYYRRLLRLFPIYWLAHILYLVSPSALYKDPVDFRFLLSFLGDRIYPVDALFYYINPAWWFFGLLVELYLVFPLLFNLLKRVRPASFLIVCGLITVISRYLLVFVIHAHGNYVQGAFFGARLWEFALGMVLALLCHRDPRLFERYLFSGPILIGGIILYALGTYSYQPTFTYTLTDALIATGLFVVIAQVARWSTLVPLLGSAMARAGVYSYSIYLLHQPYVMYFGEKLRPFSMPAYVACMTVIIAIVSAGAGILERYVNGLTARLTGPHA